jgi:hypothetical protein
MKPRRRCSVCRCRIPCIAEHPQRYCNNCMSDYLRKYAADHKPEATRPPPKFAPDSVHFLDNVTTDWGQDSPFVRLAIPKAKRQH